MEISKKLEVSPDDRLQKEKDHLIIEINNIISSLSSKKISFGLKFFAHTHIPISTIAEVLKHTQQAVNKLSNQEN